MINNILAILINNIAIISIINEIKDIINSIIKPKLADNLDTFKYIRLTSNYYLRER